MVYIFLNFRPEDLVDISILNNIIFEHVVKPKAEFSSIKELFQTLQKMADFSSRNFDWGQFHIDTQIDRCCKTNQE